MTYDRDIPILDDETDYVTWKKKVDIWKLGTNAKPEQQAAKLIMHMRGKPQEVAINISTTKIGSADGVKELLTELDLLYKKDTTQSLFKAIDSFENYRRTKDEDMDTYISEFQRRYNTLKQLQANKDLYDDVILAYRLLNQASLNEEQARLVRATCTAELTFKNMKEQLKRTFGDAVVNVEKPATKPFKTLEGADIKQEVFYTRSRHPEYQYSDVSEEEEEFGNDEDGYERDIYWTSQPHQFRKSRAYHHNNPRYNPYAGKRDKFQQNHRPYLQRGSKRPVYSDKRGHKSPDKGVCFICKQPGHKCATCPHNTFSKAGQQKNIFALYGSDFSLPDSEEEVIFLTGQCVNKALIDTGASATVCGREWYTVFENSLSEEDRCSIMEEDIEKVFRFGDGKPVKAISLKTIPIRICERDIFLKTFVVENDIPLLLSKQTMMKMGMVIDMQNMVVRIKDSEIPEQLESTDSGHVTIQISRQSKDSKALTFLVSEKSEPKKTADFYHRYFAHSSAGKIGKVIKDAKLENGDDIIKELEKIDQTCDFCLKHRKRSTPHNKVGIPQGSTFNEVVAMDLKTIDEKLMLLHLVDTVTRYSVAAKIISKEAKEILDTIFRHWIAIFGTPVTFILDNGGEFVNDAFNQACSVLNIRIKTSPAESPWCNGLVERHNFILGGMIKSLLEDLQCEPEIVIAWAVNAKNSLTNTYGFSTHQLVFGTNPRLPGNWGDVNPGTLNHEDMVKIVGDHLNALAIARQKFIELEANDKLKRALQQRIYPQTNIKYCSGDIVFFKRDNRKFWYGPAIVVGHIANQVLIKHGGYIVRVHPCKVVLKEKADAQIEDSAEIRQETSRKAVTPVTESRPESRHEEDCSDEEPEETEEIDEPETLPTPSAESNVTTDTNPPEVVDSEENTTADDSTNWHRVSDDSSGEKLKLVRGDVIRFRAEEPDTWSYGMIDSRTTKTAGGSRNCFNVDQDNVEELTVVDLSKHQVEKQVITTQPPDSVLLIQEDLQPVIFVIGIQDPKKIEAAKDQELKRLEEFGVYQEVKDIGQSHVSSRWVVTTKGEHNQLVKARLVARGFEETCNIKTDSPTVTKKVISILLSLAASNNWTIDSLDVTSAFLQSTGNMREVYVKPPRDIRKKGIIWKLSKPLYRLGDSARRWYVTLREHLKSMNCKISILDKSLFLYYEGNKLQGIIVTHVDDLLHCGTTRFKNSVVRSIHNTFKISRNNSGIFTYLGWNVVQSKKVISVDQRNYASAIKPVEISTSKNRDIESKLTDQETTEYQKLLGKLLWLSSQSRPDLSFETLLHSTFSKSPKVKHLKSLNKLAKCQDKGPERICYRKLDIEKGDLQILCFSDASLGNISKSSARGFLIFLTDGICANLIAWSSGKVKRIVHSIFAAETLSCTEATASAIMIRQLLSEILFRDPTSEAIPIVTFTDSKQLYDSIHSSSQCNDKRLTLDIAMLQENLRTGEINEFKWIPTSKMLADCLTKKGVPCHDLCRILETGLFNLEDFIRM